MENPSTLSRFRFRDHQEMRNSPMSDASSEISSVSSNPADESELQSMAAKGISHLCSELLELKEESDEDFQRNIFNNYAVFVRLFEEVEGMGNKLIELKSQFTLQRRLVKDLINVYLKSFSKELFEMVPEESVTAECYTASEMEAHISDVSEALDLLLAENRVDEAITILEMEGEQFQRLQYDDDLPSDVLARNGSMVSERKARITLQLTIVAENPRVSAADLQKTLVGLCRLGESHLACQLLLKYYNSRIANGVRNFESAKSFSHEVSIRELAKFVFSLISQAAKGFEMLYGETSPYTSELIQWACEQTEVFVTYFNKSVKPMSESTGGLSTSVQAVQYALSFCSLLETQGLKLQPDLIRQIRPCLEEVLYMHIDHFKKVVSVFSATDAWVLCRYLVSGIMNEAGSYMIVGQQPEYCLLTSSGRKLITLLQGITANITPLVSLQMEGSILGGLMDLFAEYVGILETAINKQTFVAENGGLRINLAESLPQQISILANLSTLEHFFCGAVRGIFRDINKFAGSQHREFNTCMLFVQEANDRLRALFCQQLRNQMMSLKTGSEHRPEARTVNVGDQSMTCNLMPSAAFQVLFLELRTLNELAEENSSEPNLLMELLRELVETIFLWISNSKEIWALTEDITTKNTYAYDQKQFVLDIHFLLEIARTGGYFSDNPQVLQTLKSSTLHSAGLDPMWYVDDDDDEWAKGAAIEAIQKLIEIQEMKRPLKNEPLGKFEGQWENQMKYASDSSCVNSIVSQEGCTGSEEDEVTTEQEAAINTQTITLHDVQDSSTIECFPNEVFEFSNEHDAAEFVMNKLRGGAEIESSRSEIACREDS